MEAEIITGAAIAERDPDEHGALESVAEADRQLAKASTHVERLLVRDAARAAQVVSAAMGRTNTMVKWGNLVAKAERQIAAAEELHAARRLEETGKDPRKGGRPTQDEARERESGGQVSRKLISRIKKVHEGVSDEEFAQLQEKAIENQEPLTRKQIEDFKSEKRRQADEAEYRRKEAEKQLARSEASKSVMAQEKEELHERLEENLQAAAVAPKRYELHRMSAAEAVEVVPAGSVDVILTDPPYGTEFLDAFDELGIFAKHALKEGGWCVIMPGNVALDRKIERLGRHISYRDCGTWFMPNSHAPNRYSNVRQQSKVLLFYQNGGGRYVDRIRQGYIDAGPEGVVEAQGHHFWGQPLPAWQMLTEQWVTPGMVVADPFVGGGTSGIAALACGAARFVGIDSDDVSIQSSEKRLSEWTDKQEQAG